MRGTSRRLNRRRFRIFTLVDDFTRECLDLVVDTSLTGLRVARELDRIAELRGYAHAWPRRTVSFARRQNLLNLDDATLARTLDAGLDDG
jgi:transposase InsO family protein